jgi:hypothetical protein
MSYRKEEKMHFFTFVIEKPHAGKYIASGMPIPLESFSVKASSLKKAQEKADEILSLRHFEQRIVEVKRGDTTLFTNYRSNVGYKGI